MSIDLADTNDIAARDIDNSMALSTPPSPPLHVPGTFDMPHVLINTLAPMPQPSGSRPLPTPPTGGPVVTGAVPATPHLLLTSPPVRELDSHRGQLQHYAQPICQILATTPYLKSAGAVQSSGCERAC